MRRIEIDCSRLTARPAAHAYLADAFDGCEYYGRNLDALHDMLTALPETLIAVRGAGEACAYAQSVLRVLRDSAKENPLIRLRLE